MKKIWRALRQAWWLVVGLAAAALGVVALVVFSRSERPSGATTAHSGTPPRKPLRERAQEEVERVRLEGELEKAELRAVWASQRIEVDEIKKQAKDDPTAARKNLAAWLQRNL